MARTDRPNARSPRQWPVLQQAAMAEVLSVLQRSRRRQRLQTLARRLSQWLTIALTLGALALASTRLAWLPAVTDPFVDIGLGLLLSVGLLASLWLPLPWDQAARQLDRLAGGYDRLATALWLVQEEPDGQQRDAPWVLIQRQSASDFARTIDLSRLLPWMWPRSLPWAVVGTLLLVAAAAIPFDSLTNSDANRPASGIAVAWPASLPALHPALEGLPEDEKALLQLGVDTVRSMGPQVDDLPTKKWLSHLEQVLQAAQDGRLDKRQALQELAELAAQRPEHLDLPKSSPAAEQGDPAQQPVAQSEEQLAEAQRQADLAVREAMMEAAEKALEGAPKTAENQELHKAVAEKDLGLLGKLAEKLADRLAKGQMDDKELAQWVKRFEQFAKHLGTGEIPEKYKKLAEQIERLRDKRKDQGGLSGTDQERLHQAQHELAQLNQTHGDQAAAAHRLERLQSQAKQAAEEMRREQAQMQHNAKGGQGPNGQSAGGERPGTGGQAAKQAMAEGIRHAADELKRENREQMARQAQRVGAARAREMREALQRAQGRTAQGGKPQAGQGQAEGQQGEQQAGQGDQAGGESKAGSSQSGQRRTGREKAGQKGQRSSQGKPGQAGDSEQGDAGPDGDQATEQAGQEERENQQVHRTENRRNGFKLGGNLGDRNRWQEIRQASGQGTTEGSGDDGPAGSQAGRGKGTDGKGDPAKKAAQTARDERVHGAQSKGPDVKQTFSDVARKGFAQSGWRDVFVQYSEVAEEMLDKERLPAGRRALVLRYFEKIRAQPGPTP